MKAERGGGDRYALGSIHDYWIRRIRWVDLRAQDFGRSVGNTETTLRAPSAHMSEETRGASRAAPIGVLTSVIASTIFGFFYLCSLLFSIQDLDAVLDSAYAQPVLTIFEQCFGRRGAQAAMGFIVVCVFHCGLFSITSNSRVIYALSRDSALPKWFAAVDKRGSPQRAVWLAVLLAFILALPALGSSVAFAAATSIATIGLCQCHLVIMQPKLIICSIARRQLCHPNRLLAAQQRPLPARQGSLQSRKILTSLRRRVFGIRHVPGGHLLPAHRQS